VVLEMRGAGHARSPRGIHFLDGDCHGRALGDSVGVNAWTKAQSYVQGTAAGLDLDAEDCAQQRNGL
jgi:hypothetical protein